MAKILVISLVDPISHPGGAGTYTCGLIESLKRGNARHEIHLLVPLHAPPGPWNRSRQLMSLARSSFSKLPAKVLFARQHEFRMRIQKTLRSHQFDAAMINGSDMLWTLDELPCEMSKILIAHNQEYQLLMQQLANYRFLPHVFRREITKQYCYVIEGFRRVQRGDIHFHD